MAKKGISVWLFSTLTFASLLHLIDGIYALILNSQIRLFKLYPFPNEKLQAITPTTYFWGSSITTLILWGITCAIAFENPVETFLNKILSDAKRQHAVEAEMIDRKTDMLDAMNETLITNSNLLAKVRDLSYNVRSEVKEIQPLKQILVKLKAEVNSLKQEMKNFEENVERLNRCPTCGKPILPEFKVCPYCGENIKLLPKAVMALKDYQ